MKIYVHRFDDYKKQNCDVRDISIYNYESDYFVYFYCQIIYPLKNLKGQKKKRKKKQRKDTKKTNLRDSSTNVHKDMTTW